MIKSPSKGPLLPISYWGLSFNIWILRRHIQCILSILSISHNPFKSKWLAVHAVQFSEKRNHFTMYFFQFVFFFCPMPHSQYKCNYHVFVRHWRERHTLSIFFIELFCPTKVYTGRILVCLEILTIGVTILDLIKVLCLILILRLSFN